MGHLLVTALLADLWALLRPKRKDEVLFAIILLRASVDVHKCIIN